MKAPCIRNLKAFEKGCPSRPWDGEGGCPCWIEIPVATQGDPKKKEIKRQCIDLWLFEFQWAMLGLLEGNQQATESFRNGMLEVCKDGETRPKPDQGILALFSLFNRLQEQKRIIFEHEAKKQLGKGD